MASPCYKFKFLPSGIHSSRYTSGTCWLNSTEWCYMYLWIGNGMKWRFKTIISFFLARAQVFISGVVGWKVRFVVCCQKGQTACCTQSSPPNRVIWSSSGKWQENYYPFQRRCLTFQWWFWMLAIKVFLVVSSKKCFLEIQSNLGCWLLPNRYNVLIYSMLRLSILRVPSLSS